MKKTVDFKGYHLMDYIQAIQREQVKRQKTYPKMLEKDKKNGASESNLTDRSDVLNFQYQNLDMVLRILRGDTGPKEPNDLYYKMWVMDALQELVREMNCRFKFYERMIFRKRITPEIAAQETAIWIALVLFFSEEYLPLVKVKFLKTVCKIIESCE
jgi:hypothetical protein